MAKELLQFAGDLYNVSARLLPVVPKSISTRGNLKIKGHSSGATTTTLSHTGEISTDTTAKLNGGLTVDTDKFIMTPTGIATIANNTLIQGGLIVAGTAVGSTTPTVYITGTTISTGLLTAGGGANITGTLNVAGSVTVSAGLTVGWMDITGSLTSSGSSTFANIYHHEPLMQIGSTTETTTVAKWEDVKSATGAGLVIGGTDSDSHTKSTKHPAYLVAKDDDTEPLKTDGSSLGDVYLKASHRVSNPTGAFGLTKKLTTSSGVIDLSPLLPNTGAVSGFLCLNHAQAKTSINQPGCAFFFSRNSSDASDAVGATQALGNTTSVGGKELYLDMYYSSTNQRWEAAIRDMNNNHAVDTSYDGLDYYGHVMRNINADNITTDETGVAIEDESI